MNYQQYMIDEPVRNFRALGRMGLEKRARAAFLIGFLYYLAYTLPTNLVYYFGGYYGTDDVPGAWDQLIANMTASYSADQMVASYEQFMHIARPIFTIDIIYTLLVTGPLALGMSALYLRYRRRQEGGTELIFSGFNNFLRAAGTFFLIGLFVALWSMLLIVPGIIAAYRYRLAFFILADNPDIGPFDAIRASKELMRGNKAKLFLLDFSFFAWWLLASLVQLIGTVILTVVFGLFSLTGIAGEIVSAMIDSVIAGLAFGLLYMYTGIATAAFYERAGGLLRINFPPLSRGNGPVS
jgi:uncharacterized membrane protein